MHKEILTFVVIDFADTVALNLYMSQVSNFAILAAFLNFLTS